MKCINEEGIGDPALAEKLMQLAERLSKTKGKKVYGYLKYRLGKMYLRGNEIGRDTGAAIRLLTEAAEEGMHMPNTFSARRT